MIFEIDIILLDLIYCFLFFLKFFIVNVVIECGVYFEIIYLLVLRDLICRKNFIFMVLDLVVFMKGKNIVIFSGVENEMDFCGFYDIINFGFLFNLIEE